MTSDSLSYSGEVSRKALHVVAMLIPAGMLLIDREIGLAILVPMALAAMWLDRYRTRSEAVRDWLDSHLGFMMRDTERGDHPEIVFNGATWVIVTAALLLAVFPAEYAAPGMVIAMIADAGAALVGRKWGVHQWPGTRRTVEGTVAFMVTGAATAALFWYLPWGHRLAAVGLAGIAEIPPLRINDNLLLPFVTATVFWGLAGTPPLW
jgi:dolichol kinase